MKIRHTAILASAGSGKTFQLAHRYIKLLAGGVAPDRICALTFSRKAAGEIFDSIVRYLCESAASDDVAARTAQLTGGESMSRSDFLAMLRRFLDDLHRVHVGTLDSFIVSVIRAFPMELGISSTLELFDTGGAGATAARREALNAVFHRELVDRGARIDFLAAFRQATFGREEKGLERILNALIDQFHKCYDILPNRDAWGHAGTIWPEPSRWLSRAEDIGAVADRMCDIADRAGWTDKTVNRWRVFADSVRAFGSSTRWPRDIEYLFEKISASLPDLLAGETTLKLDGRDCNMSKAACETALMLFGHVMNVELENALQRTRGIYRVLDRYEKVYDRIRRNGRMTFADAQSLLASPGTGTGLVLSRSPDADRLYIDYRLNCRLDHWLLDEFQDTSDLQWAVLANLADEVLQDDSGRRSFFYVGDVKQAIHGWRGGNVRLFEQVLRSYRSRMELVPMNVSYRSCAEVIETVNKTFANLPADVPEGTRAAWERSWQDHECRQDRKVEAGYAAVLEPPYDGKNKPSKHDRYRVALQVLREIDPVSRGLSVAVLVRKNSTGKEIVDFLRRECPHTPVVHEGRAAINDNPVVCLLLSLVQIAAHPGDMFAWRHLQMSPLGAYVRGAGPDRAALPLSLLKSIHRDGYQSFLREWAGLLDKEAPLDAFGRKRMDDLLNAAADFDNTGQYDCTAFVEFVRGYETREPPTGSAVRVMTVHQAKGLGFDAVILPELMGQSVTGGGQPGFIISRHRTDSARWALKMPRRMVAENDPVLAAELKAYDEDECFEELCVLYVAMTRARRGLYMITSYPGPTAKSMDHGALIKTRLAGDMKPASGPVAVLAGEETTCLYERGKRSWYTSKTPAPAAPAPVPRIADDFPGKKSVRMPLRHIEPSEETEHVRKASWLFNPEARDVLSFGSAIHELFQAVEWSDDADVDELVSRWAERSPVSDEVKRDVGRQFADAFPGGEIAQLLRRPEEDTELWRERHFEMVMDDRLIAGAFDRVTIRRDSYGKPVSAVIVDYKSDRIAGDSELEKAVKTHRPQLTLYRRALAAMLGMSESKVAAKLAFTRPGKVVDVQ